MVSGSCRQKLSDQIDMCMTRVNLIAWDHTLCNLNAIAQYSCCQPSLSFHHISSWQSNLAVLIVSLPERGQLLSGQRAIQDPSWLAWHRNECGPNFLLATLKHATARLAELIKCVISGCVAQASCEGDAKCSQAFWFFVICWLFSNHLTCNVNSNGI